MATPNTTFTELVTTTLRKRTKSLADNVLDHNALLRRLQQRGNTKLIDGGRTIVEELEYAENQTFQYYDGYEELDITPSTVFSAAEYNWKQWAVTISIDGKTLRQNSGETRMIDLFASRMRNAEKTLMNNIATGIYSDGSDTKGIDGLQLLVADDNDGDTVGGIDSSAAANAFWRNYSSGDVTLSATTIQSEMQDAWLDLLRGTDHPQLIMADSTTFSYFWDSLLDIQRIGSAQQGDSGFESLMFHGPGGRAEVVYDDKAPSNHMYLLNLDYLFWKVHRDANMVPLNRRESVNQDAVVVPIIGMGNMTLSNRSLQGVIYT